MGTSKRSRQKANREQGRAEAQKNQARRKVRKRAIQFGVGIPAVILILILFVRIVSGDSDDTTTPTDTTVLDTTVPNSTETTVAPTETVPGAAITGETPCPATDGSAERTTSFENAPQLCIDPSKTYTATFTTSQGVVEVELDTDNTPNTVNNFVVLSRYKYYDGSFFFRTDTSIDIIQGGGQSNTDDPGYSIEDEGSGYTYVEGDFMMARTSQPNSAGAQFFFATGPRVSALDGQGTYVKFGKVTAGLDVLKKIMSQHQDNGGGNGAPNPPVVVESVVIAEK